MSGDKPKRNSVSKTNPPKSKDNKAKPQKEPQKPKDTDGDEEMTVVVPPAKTTAGKDNDVVMDSAEEAKSEEAPVDPKVKAMAGTYSCFSVHPAVRLIRNQTSRPILVY